MGALWGLFRLVPLRFYIGGALVIMALGYHAVTVRNAYKSGKKDAISAIKQANAEAKESAIKATHAPDFLSCDPFKWNRKTGRCEK